MHVFNSCKHGARKTQNKSRPKTRRLCLPTMDNQCQQQHFRLIFISGVCDLMTWKAVTTTLSSQKIVTMFKLGYMYVQPSVTDLWRLLACDRCLIKGRALPDQPAISLNDRRLLVVSYDDLNRTAMTMPRAVDAYAPYHVTYEYRSEKTSGWDRTLVFIIQLF